MEKILVLAAISFAGWIAYSHTGKGTTAIVAGNPTTGVAGWDIVYNYPTHFTGGSIPLPQLASGQEASSSGCSICSLFSGPQI